MSQSLYRIFTSWKIAQEPEVQVRYPKGTQYLNIYGVLELDLEN